jgi:hypothetical protein
MNKQYYKLIRKLRIALNFLSLVNSMDSRVTTLMDSEALKKISFFHTHQ